MIERNAALLESPVNEVRDGHPGLVEEPLVGGLIELTAQEVRLGAHLLSLLTRILHLQTWLQEREVAWDIEVELEEGGVGIEAEPGKPLTVGVPHVVAGHALVLVEVLVVLAELLLRVHVLQQLGSVPPLLVGLHHHGFGLDFLDELLGPLSQHGRKVRATNQEDLLSIESLSQVHEGRLEAVDPERGH